MKPGPLVVGAAVVLAAGIALYFAVGSDDVPPVTADPVRKITQAGPGNPSAMPRPRRVAPEVTARADASVTDYMVGGVRVRDHRSGDRTPSTTPPAIHPPEGRKIPSQLTSDVAQRIRVVMTECAITLPSNARGANPRLDGTIWISIIDGQATVTSATVQLRDVSASAAAPVKHCIEHNAVGVAASAGNEPDLSGYTIALAFRLP